ncbi:MAG: 4-hydroxy-tetrahydrodipicolinate reductase [Planctomycetota bacterium]
MGRSLIRAVHDTEGMVLVGAVEREGSDHLGADTGALCEMRDSGIVVSSDPLPLFAKADAVIDFTGPDATVAFAELAAQARIVHVIGTTGMSDAQDERLNACSRHARIVQSGNYSAGVIALAVLVERAARALPDFDLEVLEMHHKHKVDAPSGTALLLGESAAKGRGIPLAGNDVRTRDGITGAREDGTIGFATLRGGSVVGEHSVILAGEGERLELTHRATDRQIFAKGALRAAQWAFDQKPGRYDMLDVLGLKEAP